jgi:hypothetical protein
MNTKTKNIKKYGSRPAGIRTLLPSAPASGASLLQSRILGGYCNQFRVLREKSQAAAMRLFYSTVFFELSPLLEVTLQRGCEHD